MSRWAIFLSGGVDSSAIAALAQRAVSRPVANLRGGLRGSAIQRIELCPARGRSAIGTEHREVIIGIDDFFGALPRLIWHEDEPIAWPSSVSLYFVSKLAAQHVKVVLTGEGSDELFAGYERYRWQKLNQRWARALRASCPSRCAAGFATRSRRPRCSAPGCVASCGTPCWAAISVSSRCSSTISIARSMRAPGCQDYMRYWNAHPEDSPLARTLYADQKTYLVELLMKQDQMSMAASIESRVPFLDHTLVEFAARIPGSASKIRGRTQKYILKDAVERLASAATSFIARRWVSRRRSASGCWIRAPSRCTPRCVRATGCWQPILTCARWMR